MKEINIENMFKGQQKMSVLFYIFLIYSLKMNFC